jgi:phosphonate transport system substrate-binding protein
VDPDRDLKVVDAGSHEGVAAAVLNGEVDGGATYVDARTRIQEDHPEVMEEVMVIEVSADIPNDGVQFQTSIPQELRDKIVQALLEIAETEEGKEALDVAYDWTALAEHGDDFYDPFRQVLQASGVNVKDLMQE